jgi:hypothetical protein
MSLRQVRRRQAIEEVLNLGIEWHERVPYKMPILGRVN